MNHIKHNHFRMFLWLGIWVLILPYFGVPMGWKKLLWVLTALILFYYAYREYVLRQAARAKKKIQMDTFAESPSAAREVEVVSDNESLPIES